MGGLVSLTARGSVGAAGASTPAVRVEMLGTRGLPNNYGGSETCIEEVGVRLKDRGVAVRVFCRPRVTGSRAPSYRGLDLVPLPSVPAQVLDTLSHSALAIGWLTLKRVDRSRTVLHFHGAGNGAVLPLARLLGLKTVLTVDGADWRREKWGRISRRLLRLAARIGARFADAVVADSRQAQEVYSKEFGVAARFIPYGAPEPHDEPDADGALARISEKARSAGYFVFVGRLVPEKDVLTLVRAHSLLEHPRPRLVIVGGGPQTQQYEAQLRNEAAADCEFIGPAFGPELSPVLRHALGYVQPSAVEGTSPMLLTAMAHGMSVAASDIPENVETVGEDGIYFHGGDAKSCARALRELEQARSGDALRRRVRELYDWDVVTSQYEEAYQAALAA